MEMLQLTYLNNTVLTWTIVLGVVLGSWCAIRIMKGLIQRKMHALAKTTTTDLGDLVADLLGAIKGFFILAVALYFGSRFLELPETASKMLSGFLMLALLAQAILWGNRLITFWGGRFQQKGEISQMTITVITIISRITLFTLIVLVALDNFGFDITALVAGLGVGGVAVALAVQNILSDLLSSLSIMFDKPFEIGDFIIVGDLMGTVEHVGLKTTRVRSLSGEQLVFSNSDLLQSRIRNFKRMYERRVLFGLGVTYQTSAEQLKVIPGMIKDIIMAQANVRFDRAHFKEYGDFSLNFEIVYYVLISDYKAYMDVQQEINLAIYAAFAQAGIEFAYPTQTLFMEKTASGS